MIVYEFNIFEIMVKFYVLFIFKKLGVSNWVKVVVSVVNIDFN